MAKKNHTVEQIIGKLREAEVRLSQGETVGQGRDRLVTIKPTRGYNSPGCHSTLATTRRLPPTRIGFAPRQQEIPIFSVGPTSARAHPQLCTVLSALQRSSVPPPMGLPSHLFAGLTLSFSWDGAFWVFGHKRYPKRYPNGSRG